MCFLFNGHLCALADVRAAIGGWAQEAKLSPELLDGIAGDLLPL